MWTPNFCKTTVSFFFKKYIVVRTYTFGCQKFVQYIRMIYPGCLILIESVPWINFLLCLLYVSRLVSNFLETNCLFKGTALNHHFPAARQ